MNSSRALQVTTFFFCSAASLPGEKDEVTFTALKEPAIVHLDKGVKWRSLTFDPGALHAIQIKGQPIELVDGGSITFAKLPGDVGMKKTASASIASDLLVSGGISMANQNRHYLGGEKLVVTGKLKGDGEISIGGVEHGIVQLTGDNSEYAGAFVIEKGSLMLSHSAALGSGTKPVTLNGGAVVIGARVSTTHDFAVSANAQWDAHGPNGTHDGTITIHKDATFTVKNGGGNTMTWRGEITGAGDLAFSAHGTTFAGDKSNTLSGAVKVGGLPRGATIMARAPGTNVIPSSLVMVENGILRWGADEQIADTVPVTFQGELPTLELRGHKERVGVLKLQGDAQIDLGEDGELSFADSSQVRWHHEKILMVRGGGTIRFGKDESGLTTEQLRQIGFVDPEGFPTGTYTAKLSADGKLLPTGGLVVPVGLPVDLSPEAHAKRRTLYETDGLQELTRDQTPLKKSGTVISFYGDSITWGGGYVQLIQKAISEGKETRDLGVKLINHGVNGGGVLTLRDGDKGTAHFGNTQPRPFSETLAEDKADVVVIYIGVNDVWWRKTPPEVFENALTNLVTQAKTAGARPVLATLAMMKEKVGEQNEKCDAFAEITRQVAKTSDATLVDLRAGFMACLENESIVVRPGGAWTSNAQFLAHDGVHPSSRGNQIIAELIAQGIARALEK